MSWTFEQLQKSPQSWGTNTSLAFDGRNIWIGSGTNIGVYGYWDSNSNYEFLSQPYYFNSNVNMLYLYRNFSINTPIPSIGGLAQSIIDMTYWNGKMYVLTSTNIIQVFDTTTYQLIQTLTCPNMCQAKIVAANNKIWLTSLYANGTDQQELMYYDILLSTWSSLITLPGRKQSTVRDMVDGLNGYLYITSYNEHSIIKVNTTNGTIITSYKINRHPEKLSVTQNKDVYIVSDVGATFNTGMISKLEQNTYTSTRICAAGGSVENLAIDIDTGYMWHIGKTAKLGRTKLASKDYRYVGGTSNGFSIDFNEFSPSVSTAITTGLITEPIFYQKWNGSSIDTILVRPYLCFVAGGYLYATRLNSMIRQNSFEVLGTALIGTGPQNYIGD